MKDTVYMETVKRLEPDIAFMNVTACLPSIAISLKRIADITDKSQSPAHKRLQELRVYLAGLNDTYMYQKGDGDAIEYLNRIRDIIGE